MSLAAIPAIANLIGYSLIGMTYMGISFRMPFVNTLFYSIMTYIFTLVGIIVVAFIINALAPQFSSQADMVNAVKLVVYSYTPMWIASILFIIPMLSVLVLIASLYGLYLFYVGLPILMDTPPEKRLVYFIVIIVVTIVVYVIVGLLGGLFLPTPGTIRI